MRRQFTMPRVRFLWTTGVGIAGIMGIAGTKVIAATGVN